MKHSLSGVIVLFVSASAMAFAAAAAPYSEYAFTEYVSQETTAGEPSEIGHHARWDDTCEALDAPRLTIERAPSHGNICVSQGPVDVVVSRSHAGLSCIGKSVKGLHVIYSPRSGFTGVDTVRYGLDVPEGHVSLEVSIVIQPGRMKPSPVATSLTGNAQSSGPMPECAPLAS
jgi:hypothetical protein